MLSRHAKVTLQTLLYTRMLYIPLRSCWIAWHREWKIRIWFIFISHFGKISGVKFMRREKTSLVKVFGWQISKEVLDMKISLCLIISAFLWLWTNYFNERRKKKRKFRNHIIRYVWCFYLFFSLSQSFSDDSDILWKQLA